MSLGRTDKEDTGVPQRCRVHTAPLVLSVWEQGRWITEAVGQG